MTNSLLIVIVLLVVGGGIYFYINHKLDTQEKERAAYHYPDGYDALFAEVAYQSKDSSFCKKISPYATRGGVLAEVGQQIILIQSQCYVSLGECDSVHPVSTSTLDGNKYTPDYCRAHIGFYQNQPAAMMTDEQIRTILAQLGYTNLSDNIDELSSYSFNLEGSPEFQAKVRAMPDRP